MKKKHIQTIYVRFKSQISNINSSKSYSKTVLLPQTKFPLRLENKKLIQRDLAINNVSS